MRIGGAGPLLKRLHGHLFASDRDTSSENWFANSNELAGTNYAGVQRCIGPGICVCVLLAATNGSIFAVWFNIHPGMVSGPPPPSPPWPWARAAHYPFGRTGPG